MLPGVGTIIDAALWGATIGAATYTASVAFKPGGFDNWNWGDFGRSVSFGAISGVTTAGIGSLFGGSGALGHEIMRGFFHGYANGLMSELSGGEFVSGFASGTISSWLGSGVGTTSWGNTKGSMYAFSGLSGGISSVVTGGNFWEGLGVGLMTAGLNHLQQGFQNTKIRYIENATSAYYDMVANSFDVNGNPFSEVVGVELARGGTLVCTAPDFTDTTANFKAFDLRHSIDGDLVVKYKGKWVRATTTVHTHPGKAVSGIGVSIMDMKHQKSINRPIRIIYDNKVYNYYGGNNKYNYKVFKNL